ncbi:MAG: hypothetical protein K1X75_12045 [Leptospirales bacterium]|nr:hypothetical protein [Leptospirales bacterium]
MMTAALSLAAVLCLSAALHAENEQSEASNAAGSEATPAAPASDVAPAAPEVPGPAGSEASLPCPDRRVAYLAPPGAPPPWTALLCASQEELQESVGYRQRHAGPEDDCLNFYERRSSQQWQLQVCRKFSLAKLDSYEIVNQRPELRQRLIYYNLGPGANPGESYWRSEEGLSWRKIGEQCELQLPLAAGAMSWSRAENSRCPIPEQQAAIVATLLRAVAEVVAALPAAPSPAPPSSTAPTHSLFIALLQRFESEGLTFPEGANR